MGLTPLQWKYLLESIEQKKCTPFIGAGCSSKWLPIGSDIARRWTTEYGYPLEDSDDLARVAQFLAITNGDELSPKYILTRDLKQKRAPNFSLPEFVNTPYALLANLNLPIYITTNYDYFMEKALKDFGKEPVSEFCRWNNYAKAAGIDSVFDKSEGYKPTIAKPLVYHLHGVLDTPQSMVLTESDYIDFIVNLNSKSEVLPKLIRETLAATSLLFIGYSLRDMNLRIIFRGIMNFLGSQFLLPNVAVILAPKDVTENKLEVTQEYLKEYTKSIFKVDVYWGDVSVFTEDLRKRWNQFRSPNSSEVNF
jgi:hypothetical protein